MEFQDGDDVDFQFETPYKVKDEEISVKQEDETKAEGGFKSLFG